MRHALTAIAVLALASACASPGLPPGGPTISAFPRVVVTLPDTNALNVKPNKVLVRYDDVISEQANGAPLNRSVLISPWDGEPRVEWKRTGMTIRPRDGWRANTAYTITILPGIGDLKGRPIPTGYVLRFSTGATIPTGVLRGDVFDWVANRALAKATVLATDVKDTSLVYLTVADSSGRFTLGAMPPGTYLVRAIDEKTPNRALDAREPWDSATVTVADSARAEFYTFVHDTLPARISEIRQGDSLSIVIVMDKPLLPGVAIPATAAHIVTADSTIVNVATIMTAAEERIAREKADSIARAADTTRRGQPEGPRRTIDPTRRRDTAAVVPPPMPKRTPPATELIIKLRDVLKPGTTYRVTLSGVKNLLGIEGTSSRLLIIPRAPASDSTRARPPATPPARPDSTRTPPGTVVPPPASRRPSR